MTKTIVRSLVFAVLCVLAAAIGTQVVGFSSKALELRYAYTFLFPAALSGFLVWYFFGAGISEGKKINLVVPSLVLGGGYGGVLLGIFSFNFGGAFGISGQNEALISGFAYGVVGGFFLCSPISAILLFLFAKVVRRIDEAR